jgi:hypothetical protein
MTPNTEIDHVTDAAMSSGHNVEAALFHETATGLAEIEELESYIKTNAPALLDRYERLARTLWIIANEALQRARIPGPLTREKRNNPQYKKAFNKVRAERLGKRTADPNLRQIGIWLGKHGRKNLIGPLLRLLDDDERILAFARDLPEDAVKRTDKKTPSRMSTGGNPRSIVKAFDRYFPDPARPRRPRTGAKGDVAQLQKTLAERDKEILALRARTDQDSMLAPESSAKDMSDLILHLPISPTKFDEFLKLCRAGRPELVKRWNEAQAKATGHAKTPKPPRTRKGTRRSADDFVAEKRIREDGGES